MDYSELLFKENESSQYDKYINISIKYSFSKYFS